MSLTKACCTLPPVVSDYNPPGTTVQVDDLPIYETIPNGSKRLLICVYDIFGVHPNIRQVSETLALAGFRVVIPDFFRCKPITKEVMAQGMPAILAFIEENGNWKKSVKIDVQNVIKHYQQTEGITSIGIFGFCWGGRITLDAVLELDEINAGGLVHPSLIKNEEAERVKRPMILLPAKDEPDMIPFYETLKKNLGESNCAHRRFDDLHHGFCGARGNFSDELNSKRVNEVIQLLSSFFLDHV